MFYIFILESIGTSELLLIGLVALIVFGPRKLPEFARMLGKAKNEFKRTTDDFRQTWEREVNFETVEKQSEPNRIDALNDVNAASVQETNNISANEIAAPEIREISQSDFQDNITEKKLRLPNKSRIKRLTSAIGYKSKICKTLFSTIQMNSDETNNEEQLGKQMSFLEHLDEFRKRLVNSVIVIVIAFLLCFYVSDKIYNFLSVPIRQALSEANRREVPVEGRTGDEKVLSINTLEEGAIGRYVFDRATTLGVGVVSSGTSVAAKVEKDATGKIGLFSDEPIFTNNAVIPKGIRLPVNFEGKNLDAASADERLIVTTAQEGFTLYVTVSLYAAIALSIPFLLFQVWGFISPALYRHERAYVTPFIALSTISFVIGAAFAYYILFPPAVKYLLGISSEFQLMLRATDYFELITLIMLAMGIIFQMPAITYVLSRIGLINHTLLIKGWKIAIVVILIVAAVASPTADIPNMMLFAAPMICLYMISIFIAWLFGRRRKNDAEAESIID